MANKIDEEIYPDNDDLVHVAPTYNRANPSTGVYEENVSLTGRADGVAFLSLTDYTDPTATAIDPSLSVALVEIAATGYYAGVMTGANKTTALTALADGDPIHKHFKFGQTYHTSVPCTWRKTRPEALT